MKQVSIMDIVGNSTFDDRLIMRSHNKGLILIMDDMGRVFDETWRYIADGAIIPGHGVGSEGYKEFKENLRKKKPKAVNL